MKQILNPRIRNTYKHTVYYGRCCMCGRKLIYYYNNGIGSKNKGNRNKGTPYYDTGCYVRARLLPILAEQRVKISDLNVAREMAESAMEYILEYKVGKSDRKAAIHVMWHVQEKAKDIYNEDPVMSYRSIAECMVCMINLVRDNDKDCKNDLRIYDFLYYGFLALDMRAEAHEAIHKLKNRGIRLASGVSRYWEFKTRRKADAKAYHWKVLRKRWAATELYRGNEVKYPTYLMPLIEVERPPILEDGRIEQKPEPVPLSVT